MSYASHVDALDVQCVSVKHVMLEPNPKTVFGGCILKREGSAGELKIRPKVGRAQGLNSINTDSVLPQESPGACPIILNLRHIYMFLLLVY